MIQARTREKGIGKRRGKGRRTGDHFSSVPLCFFAAGSDDGAIPSAIERPIVIGLEGAGGLPEKAGRPLP